MKKLIIFLLLSIFPSQYAYADWGQDLLNSIVEGVAEGLEEQISSQGGNLKYYDYDNRNEELTKAQTKGKAYIEKTFDNAGSVISERAFGDYGEPVRLWNYHGGTGVYSCHRMDYKYDDSGNCIEVTCWDEKGKPDVDCGGCHKIEFTFYSIGQKETEKYYDKSGKLIQYTKYYSNGVVMESENYGF